MKTINKGIYLVIDPDKDKSELINQLLKIKDQKLSAIQIWDNFKPGRTYTDLLSSIKQLFKDSDTPIFINNRIDLMVEFGFDGVHFDEIPIHKKEIEAQINRPFLKGLTLTNDLDALLEESDWQFDYVSFCSIFQSPTSNSCELVDFETIERCKELKEVSIFLSGGITPDNMEELKELNYDGIAVVSGIMNAENPLKSLNLYKEKLK